MTSELFYITNHNLPTPRAHGLQVAKMCEAFVEAGVKLTILAPNRKLSYGQVQEYYHLRTPLNIRYLKTWDLTGKIPKIGFWLQSMTFAWSAWRCVRRSGYIGPIYSRDQFSLLFISLLSQNCLIYEIHNLPLGWSWWHKLLFSRLRGVVTISRGLTDDLVKKGFPEDKIITAPDAYDPAEFSFETAVNFEALKQKLHFPSDKTLCLYMGSFLSWKGVETLLQAAKYLDRQYHLVLVGGWPVEQKRLELYCKEHGLQPIDIRPRVNQAEVSDYLRCADILLLPNSGKEEISRRYTSPLKFFEYLASGKPIVVSNLPSLHEIGDSFEGLYYFQADDPEHLAQQIQLVKVGQHYVRNMAGATWSQRVQHVLAAIDKFCK